MRCLDDDIVLGLIEGRLAPPILADVDDHLDSCETCRDVVSQVARVQAPAHVLSRGHALGRYVIGDLLGTGAMGRVYSAWEPELDRRVAIKVLVADGADARERIVREAQAMAKLDHPNVVGVHEVGTSEDGVFVAMELVDGVTLRAWAIAEARPWRQVAAVLAEIARGLEAVHAAGVTHRDIKPDNIIVGTDGRARLGDFGLARSGGGAPVAPGEASHAGGTSATTGRPLANGTAATVVGTPTAHANGTAATATGTPTAHANGMAATVVGTPTALAGGTPTTAIAGTPAYMAPEVLRGGSASAASDQFSFGATAYEVIAGVRPFSGASWAELLTAIETKSVTPLRSVPGWLDELVRRCLSVDPARRFPSMLAIAEHIAAKTMQRSPALMLGGVLAAAVVASGATLLLVRGNAQSVKTCDVAGDEMAAIWNPAMRTRLSPLGAPALAALDRWAESWIAEKGATCRAAPTLVASKRIARERCLDQRRAELGALVSRFDTAAQAAGSEAPLVFERAVDALAALAPPSECAAAELGSADPLPLDPALAAIAREVEHGLPAIRAANALGDSRPVLATSTSLVERARSSGHAPTLAEALLVQSETLRGASQLAEAQLAARDALAAAERGHDDLTAARAWIARVATAGDRRELTLAEDFGAIAAAAVDRAGAPPHLVATLFKLRGLVAYNRGNFTEATTLLTEAHKRFSAFAGPRSLEVATVESVLGSVARAAGDLDAAEKWHRNALAIDQELRGGSQPKTAERGATIATHPDIARDLHNLAGVLRLRGDLDGATVFYNNALAIEEASRGPKSVEAALTHNSLGLVALAQKDWPAARRELATSRDLLVAAGHGDRAFAHHNLGILEAAVGDHRLALKHYERAAEAYAITIGDKTAPAIRILLDRARSQLRLDDTMGFDTAQKAADAAHNAGIFWIEQDAKLLLSDVSGREPRKKPSRSPATPVEVVVEPPIRGTGTTTGTGGTKPVAAEVTPIPEPPKPEPPKPEPKRDVGVYGSTQPW